MKKSIINNKNINRRGFIQRSWKILGIAALAEFSFMGISSIRRRDTATKSSEDLFDAGKIEVFAPGTVTSFRSNRFFLYRSKNGGFLAITVACSHLGCAVNWDPGKNKFFCPCHASSFDMQGNVLTSPAPRALDSLPVTIENGHIMVNVSQPIKRKHFDKNQLVYAG